MTAATGHIVDGETLTVQIPLRLRKRGGRKLMVVPEGATAWAPQPARVDSAMVKALARAHRWRRMLESGEYASVTELAAAEKINQSYLCRVLRLTLLAPKMAEAILDGRQPPEITMAALMEPFPVEWRTQVRCIRAHNLKDTGSDAVPNQVFHITNGLAMILCELLGEQGQR